MATCGQFEVCITALSLSLVYYLHRRMSYYCRILSETLGGERGVGEWVAIEVMVVGNVSTLPQFDDAPLGEGG